MVVKHVVKDDVVQKTRLHVTTEETLIIVKALRLLGFGHYNDENAPEAIKMAEQIIDSYKDVWCL